MDAHVRGAWSPGYEYLIPALNYRTLKIGMFSQQRLNQSSVIVTFNLKGFSAGITGAI